MVLTGNPSSTQKMANPNNEVSLQDAAKALGLRRVDLFEMADRGELKIYALFRKGYWRKFVLREDLEKLLRQMEASKPATEFRS